MQLHLFSSPGEPFLSDILEAARSILAEQADPVVAYLPAANVQRHFIRETKTAFRALARVTAIKVEYDAMGKIRAALDRASLLYIPGGNTYLLAHRLHTAGLLGEIRDRILGGLPLVTFSAGTVFCGLDILTTNDINCCGCTQFTGLGLVSVNFNVHYPPAGREDQGERDERLEEYQAFHSTPVLALEDGAYLEVSNGAIRLVRGAMWRFEKGRPKAYITTED